MLGSVFQLFFLLVSAVGTTYIKNSRTWFMTFNLAVSIAGAVMVREINASNKWGRLVGQALAIAYPANFPMVMAMTSSNFGGFTKKTTVSALVSGFQSCSIFTPPSLRTALTWMKLGVDVYRLLRWEYRWPAAVLCQRGAQLSFGIPGHHNLLCRWRHCNPCATLLPHLGEQAPRPGQQRGGGDGASRSEVEFDGQDGPADPTVPLRVLMCVSRRAVPLQARIAALPESVGNGP
jgi:hypothetical protein